MLGTWGCRVVDGVSDPDDRGVDCGVEVPDCPGWICVSFGVDLLNGVLEIMKDCGQWASVSESLSPKSVCDSALKMVCPFYLHVIDLALNWQIEKYGSDLAGFARDLPNHGSKW